MGIIKRPHRMDFIFCATSRSTGLTQPAERKSGETEIGMGFPFTLRSVHGREDGAHRLADRPIPPASFPVPGGTRSEPLTERSIARPA